MIEPAGDLPEPERAASDEPGVEPGASFSSWERTNVPFAILEMPICKYIKVVRNVWREKSISYPTLKLNLVMFYDYTQNILPEVIAVM